MSLYFHALVTSGGAICLAWTHLDWDTTMHRLLTGLFDRRAFTSCRDWSCRSLFIWLAFVSYWLKLPSVNWLWPFGVHNYRVLTNACFHSSSSISDLSCDSESRTFLLFVWHMTNMKLGPHHTLIFKVLDDIVNKGNLLNKSRCCIRYTFPIVIFPKEEHSKAPFQTLKHKHI